MGGPATTTSSTSRTETLDVADEPRPGVSGGESWPCPARTPVSWSTSSTSSARTTPLWDAPRRPVGATGAGTLRIRHVGPVLPRVRVADPDRAGRLVDVPVRSEGAFAAAELPAPHVWQVVLVEPAP